MSKVVIVGSGGHAKVVADILRGMGEYVLEGFTSPEKKGPVLGYPVLGDDAVLPTVFQGGITHAFVAIGANDARLRATKRVLALGFTLASAISPRACISPSAGLGRGIAIMPGAVVNVDSAVGDGAIVNTGATVDHDNVIGAFSHVAPGCSLAGNVTVGEGAFLGVGCKAIPGVSIGEWSVVGAGSVLVRDVPPYSMAYGVPAKTRRPLGPAVTNAYAKEPYHEKST